jgi:hypothetical protein
MLEKLAVKTYNLAMKSMPARSFINSTVESSVLAPEMIRCDDPYMALPDFTDTTFSPHRWG